MENGGWRNVLQFYREIRGFKEPTCSCTRENFWRRGRGWRRYNRLCSVPRRARDSEVGWKFILLIHILAVKCTVWWLHVILWTSFIHHSPHIVAWHCTSEDTVVIPCVTIHSFSTEPRAKKKEYVVPLIKQNNWRLPVKSNQSEGGDEGSGVGDPLEKNDEQLSLKEQAAQAIIQGEQTALEPQIHAHLYGRVSLKAQCSSCACRPCYPAKTISHLKSSCAFMAYRVFCTTQYEMNTAVWWLVLWLTERMVWCHVLRNGPTLASCYQAFRPVQRVVSWMRPCQSLYWRPTSLLSCPGGRWMKWQMWSSAPILWVCEVLLPNTLCPWKEVLLCEDAVRRSGLKQVHT